MFSKIGHILHPILLGIFLAYLMEPVTFWFQNWYESHAAIFRKKPRFCRAAAVFSCFLFFFLVFLLGITLLSLNIAQYFKEVSWEGFVDKMNRAFLPLIDFFKRLGDGDSRYSTMLFSMAEGKLTSILKNLMESTLSIPSLVGQFFIGLIIALYLLIDKETFLSYGKKAGRRWFSPERRKMVRKIGKEFQIVFSGYLKGQAMDAFLMGCLLSAGLWLIGVPLGISIGILAGVGNLVPYLGPFVAYVLTIFFCLLEGRHKTLWIALIYLLVIQQIDGSFIGPKLLGNQIRLRPIFILIAVLAGGTFFGPLGMILAVPFAGLIKSISQLLSKEKLS